MEEELYKVLINHSRFTSTLWDNVSLVISKSGNSCFGYRFHGETWEAFGPRDWDWADKAEALYKAMLEEGRPWIKMLMCLNKENNSYTIEYEFEDENRWSLGSKDMGSIEEFAYSLKRE